MRDLATAERPQSIMSAIDGGAMLKPLLAAGRPRVATLSLTDLVDVVSAAGRPKATKVKRIKHRPPYTPVFDFYRPFRQHLRALHASDGPKAQVRAVIQGLTDAKKQRRYPDLVKGYCKWWGRKSLDWFEPPAQAWSAHGIDVRVNPELGLVVNGTPHVIKLYMKGRCLTKSRADLIMHLMGSALSGTSPAGAVMAVLDVRRAKLMVPTVRIGGLGAMLDAELAYVAALWRSV